MIINRVVVGRSVMKNIPRKNSDEKMKVSFVENFAIFEKFATTSEISRISKEHIVYMI